MAASETGQADQNPKRRISRASGKKNLAKEISFLEGSSSRVLVIRLWSEKLNQVGMVCLFSRNVQHGGKFGTNL